MSKETATRAQPGHQRQWREPLLPERVDETLDYEIEETKYDGLTLPHRSL